MANLATFGDPPGNDTITIQGQVYALQSAGMRAMRKVLEQRRNASRQAAVSGADADSEVGDAMLTASIEYVIANVRPEDRERLREHIEESVPPRLVVELSRWFMGGIGQGADVPPTPPSQSSDGSSLTGADSTAGASLGV